MADVQMQAPVTPARLRARYDVSPERMCVTYRPRSWAVGGFMLVWLIGWSVGCAFLAHQAIHKPQLFILLFGIPFWVSWLFVFAILVGAFTRRQDLEVDAAGLRYRDWAVVNLANRWIPREEFRGFEVVTRYQQRNQSESTPQTGLEIRAVGKPLFVFTGLPDAELRWLAWQLSQLVDALPSDAASADGEPAATGAPADAPADALGPLPLALTVGQEPVDPPSDCSWELAGDFQSLEFAQRGRWSWAAVLGLLFVTAFWNGIVGVFVLNLLGLAPGKGPAGGEWWFLFFFLIPFEVIGLCMFLALFAALLEPVRRKIWRFDANEIECRLSWLGIGPRWLYPVSKLDRIELIRGPATRRQAGRRKHRSATIEDASWADADHKFGLSLVQAENAQLCEIKPLTEGEARWMADAVLRARPEWFR
jgi:hypothetical protein